MCVMGVKREPTGKKAPAKHEARPARGGTPRERATRRAIRGMAADVEAVNAWLAELSRVAETPRSDFEEAGEVFVDELRSLVGDTAPDAATVRRAARVAVAEQAWAQRLGTLLETRDVVELLGVSKQRVSTLARDRRLIALSQAGRLRFPAWQFATSDTEDRECVAAAHAALTEQGSVSPWAAAAWFREPHPSLDDKDPVAFLRGGGARSRVLEAAARDAARLAQ